MVPICLGLPEPPHYSIHAAMSGSPLGPLAPGCPEYVRWVPEHASAYLPIDSSF